MRAAARGKFACGHEPAAIAQYAPGTPHLQKQEERAEADNCAGDVRQVRTEVNRNRELARDVAQ
jgi:hypothetical protein